MKNHLRHPYDYDARRKDTHGLSSSGHDRQFNIVVIRIAKNSVQSCVLINIVVKTQYRHRRSQNFCSKYEKPILPWRNLLHRIHVHRNLFLYIVFKHYKYRVVNH